MNSSPEMSLVEERIDRLVKKWEWVIGGVVDEDPRYVRAIIHDFLGVDIPKGTYESRSQEREAQEAYKRAQWAKEDQ
jgi:hypothetical protein